MSSILSSSTQTLLKKLDTYDVEATSDSDNSDGNETFSLLTGGSLCNFGSIFSSDNI